MIFMFRRRTFFTILIICCLLIAVSCFIVMHSQVLTTPTLSWQLAEHTFIVDPGHGGTFPGRVNSDQVLEKDINLAIGLQLYQYLQESGAITILTRDTDIDLIPEESKKEKLKLQQRADLQERLNLAIAEESDYFISIHCNSIPNEKWTGAQTFYNPDDPESKRLAQSIQNRIISQLQNTQREALPRADTFLFKNSTIPTVIVECGFLSNVEEAAQLQDPAYQQEIAYAIFLGINDFLSAQ